MKKRKFIKEDKLQFMMTKVRRRWGTFSSLVDPESFR